VPTCTEWLLLIGVGTLTAIFQLLLTEAYRHEKASFLSPLSYTVIIFATVIGYILFDIVPTLLTIIGGFLIIVGGALTYILDVKPPSLIGRIKRLFRFKLVHSFPSNPPAAIFAAPPSKFKFSAGHTGTIFRLE